MPKVEMMVSYIFDFKDSPSYPPDLKTIKDKMQFDIDYVGLEDALRVHRAYNGKVLLVKVQTHD